MFTQSLWNKFADIYDHPILDKDISVDAAIIGGGVTGISTALQLSEKGYKVAVIEALKVGGGTSSHSTGNLYFTIDRNLDELKSKYDIETVKSIIAARSAALNRMEENIKKYNLDCDFIRTPWYLYAAMEQNNEKIKKELKVGHDADISITEVAPEEIPLPSTKAVKVLGQAQINPMRYVQELAKAVASDTLHIYECTRVTGIEETDDLYKVKTTGGTVTAKHVIHATHTPKGVKFVQTLLGPYREYGIACKVKNDFPEGIFWGYFENEEKISVRKYAHKGENYLIVVGKPHKVGQAENNLSKIKELEAFAQKYFKVEEVTHRWGGQHYRPADLLPYIGREAKNKEEYIATGYSTDGLVYGTLAGMIISDLIAGEENELAELLAPTRHQPLKAAKNFIKENLNVAKQYLKNIPGNAEEKDFQDIAPEEGKIVEKDGKNIAASKDKNGKLHMRSAVCTHLGCIVNWNNAEKTWDCPCHATRFKPDGTVLEGPAYEPLQVISFNKD